MKRRIQFHGGSCAIVAATIAIFLACAGAASAQTSTVPDVGIGQSPAKTVSQIRADQLSWNFVVVYEALGSVDNRIPIGQHPDPGTEITQGQNMHLFLKSLDPGEDCTTWIIIVIVETVFVLLFAGYIVYLRSSISRAD